MWGRWAVGSTVALVILVSGAACTSWHAYAPAADLVLAPKTVLSLPLHESYRHWLLISEDGWCGASVARFGGDDADPGVVVVRAAVFRDAAAAAGAYPLLTDDYIFRSLRSEMT